MIPIKRNDAASAGGGSLGALIGLLPQDLHPHKLFITFVPLLS